MTSVNLLGRHAVTAFQRVKHNGHEDLHSSGCPAGALPLLASCKGPAVPVKSLRSRGARVPAARDADPLEGQPDSPLSGSSAVYESEASTSGRDMDVPLYSLQDTKKLVDTAMMAAVGGLSFVLATTLKLEGYMGYFLPLPVVLSGMRAGPTSARKTFTATVFLLLVLLGPLQAASYIFQHGLLAVTLGVLWSWGASWAVSIPLGALAKVGGTLGGIGLACFTLHENLFAVLLNNVYSLVDQLAAFVGASGAPSPAAIVSVVGSMLVVNALIYAVLMHVLYAILLGNLGHSLAVPSFVANFLRRRQLSNN